MNEAERPSNWPLQLTAGIVWGSLIGFQMRGWSQQPQLKGIHVRATQNEEGAHVVFECVVSPRFIGGDGLRRILELWVQLAVSGGVHLLVRSIAW